MIIQKGNYFYEKLKKKKKKLLHFSVNLSFFIFQSVFISYFHSLFPFHFLGVRFYIYLSNKTLLQKFQKLFFSKLQIIFQFSDFF